MTEFIVNESNCTGCRICQLTCSMLYNSLYKPSEAFIQIKEIYGICPKITFLEGRTNCGECARYCPYEALSIKEE